MAHDDRPLPVTSSTEPDWPAGAQECYRDVLETLHAADIPYAVGGAFAMHEHTGVWRWTKDLDVMLVAENIPRALRALNAAGFDTHIADPVWLAKAERGEHFVDLITGLGNAGLAVDETWIERATSSEVLGVPCKVLGPEEMMASKIFVSRRERFDGAEVVHLIRLCGHKLDWRRLLDLLNGHWELLLWALVFFAYVYPARTGLVPEDIWNDLLASFGEKVRNPNPDEPFRGSLIDPLMFAIDVDEWHERNLYHEFCEQRACLLDEDNVFPRSEG